MADPPSIGPVPPGAPEDTVLAQRKPQLRSSLQPGPADVGLPDGTPRKDDRCADRDELTGLPGPATLLQRFEAAAATARREGKRLALLCVDLDGLEPVDAGSSQRGGDAVRQHFARRLHASVRDSDTVSRLGGDEFVVLLTGLSLSADAARVAENVLRVLSAPKRSGEHSARLSPNIGISIYPDDGVDVAALIRQADRAMQRAKRQGSGHYLFCGADEPASERRSIPSDTPGVRHPSMAGEWLRQAQLREANEQLLFAALTAQELRVAAELALGDQTALLARVAHELRNPLTPIRMAAALIDRAAFHELPRLRAVIERQVEHASRLVGDLLDMSRAQTGKLRLQRSVVDLRGIVSEVLDALRPALEARSQRLLVDMPEQPMPVDGDPVRLTQVLSNLLDNASKYTPEQGTITVVVRQDGADVVVSVADTGIGIHTTALADVFHPFVQESHATRFNGAGLGIGLTVVRELAQAHGGTVQAFSAGEGQGSRFVLTLPRHEGG